MGQLLKLNMWYGIFKIPHMLDEINFDKDVHSKVSCMKFRNIKKKSQLSYVIRQVPN